VKRVVQNRTAKPYTDYHQMLERERLDVVSVTVPTTIHKEVGLNVARHGIHTMMEKPIAFTVEEGQQLIAAARGAGVKLAVGHIERFNPAVSELKRRLDSGDLGRIFQIHTRRVGPFPSRIRDVGVVIDLATHDIDLMRYLLGVEPERIFAETQRKIHTEHEDMLSGLLKFRNGVVGILDVNWLTPTKIRELLVVGEKGMFLVNYLNQDLLFYENNHLAADNWDSPRTLMGIGEGHMVRIVVERKEPLRAELESFVGAATSGREPLVTGDDGLLALKLAHRMVESGLTGEVVRL
jgi:predicted dehydrogenase